MVLSLLFASHLHRVRFGFCCWCILLKAEPSDLGIIQAGHLVTGILPLLVVYLYIQSGKRYLYPPFPYVDHPPHPGTAPEYEHFDIETLKTIFHLIELFHLKVCSFRTDRLPLIESH